MMMIIYFMMMLFFFMIMYFFSFNLKFYFSNIFMLIILYLMFMYISYIDWFFINFNFSMNFYSFMLILLTLWIVSLVIMEINDLCLKLNLFMLNILILTFVSMNILFFYFFFEVSLIIMFILIMKWGLGKMRLLASYYFMFYTLFFSFPLLIFLIMMIFLNNICMMNLLELMNYYINMYMYMYMLMSFLIKIPIFMFHGWLLKAHVEAPVFGSMVLAAILLKLGTYGILRLTLILYINLLKLNLYLLMFSLIGSLLISIVCLQQIDMKILVAYSSVVHMGLLLSSLLTMLKMGFIGSYMMMIAHGLCSSGLFYLVNLCYNETNSRLMIINKGMMIYMSIMSLMWFLFCSSNMAAPVSLNLISEVLLLMNLIIWLDFLFYLLVFFCFFSFLYSLYLFSYIQHGQMNFYLMIKSSNMIQYLILLLHWIPLNLMFLNLIFF